MGKYESPVRGNDCDACYDLYLKSGRMHTHCSLYQQFKEEKQRRGEPTEDGLCERIKFLEAQRKLITA